MGTGNQLVEEIDSVGRRRVRSEEIGQWTFRLLLLDPFEKISGPGHMIVGSLKEMKAKFIDLLFLSLGESRFDRGQTVLEKLGNPALVS